MDPTTEALTLILTGAAFEVIGFASKRIKARVWKRRLSKAREAIPWLAPVLAAGVRGAYAQASGGEPLTAALWGGLAGAFAVYIRTASNVPRKVAEAGAPGERSGG